MENMTQIRSQLSLELAGGTAFVPLDKAIEGIPFEFADRVVDGWDYNLWQLVEHIRLGQEDLINYTVNPDYTEPKFPDDFWPATASPPDEAAWEQSVQAVLDGLERTRMLLSDMSLGLTEPVPWAKNHNLLRGVLLIHGHNAYHNGQVVALRKVLGIWP